MLSINIQNKSFIHKRGEGETFIPRMLAEVETASVGEDSEGADFLHGAICEG